MKSIYMRLHTGFILLTLFLISTAEGQDLGRLVLNKKLSILNDRAFLRLPDQAMNSSRSVDIMAADPNINAETRIVMDTGKYRLVFFAEELFSFSDGNLFSSMTKDDTSGFFKRKILSEKNNVTLLLSTPVVFDSTNPGILINSLMVQMPDRSLLRIDAYINPEAFVAKQQFQELSENVFSTFEKGGRALKREARTEVYDLTGSGKKIQIKLPKDHYITVDQKYDFQVFRVSRFQQYGDTNWISMTVYAGRHPSFFHPSYSLSESSATKTKGMFLSKEMEWLGFYEGHRKFYIKEQIIPADNVQKGLVFHVALMSGLESSVKELTKIVEGITVK
jgi:hypothetical protein